MPDDLSSPDGPFDLGEFHVEPAGERMEKGETTGRRRAVGRAVVYRFRGPGGVDLDVADVHWDNLERDVRVLNRQASPQKFDRLCHGLRMGIRWHGLRNKRVAVSIELRQARLLENDWSRAFKTSLEELDQGAGLDVRAELKRLGAFEVGTRQIVHREDGPRRNFFCALFDEANSRMPIAAYVLTRIAPIDRGIEA